MAENASHAGILVKNAERTPVLHAALYGHILDNNPALQYFFVACLGVQCIFGTVGNLLIIGSVFVIEPLRHTGNAFIVNLAAADLCVTAMAQPANILGALYGEKYFLARPVYCSLVSTLCATGCLSSCWNILMIAVNRYILICKFPYYEKIYTIRNTVLMCLAVWVIIYSIQLPNHLGWGDLRFSRIYFLCTFANHVHSYALFYIIVGVLSPLNIAFGAYLMIYLTVKDSKLTRSRILRTSKQCDNASAPPAASEGEASSGTVGQTSLNTFEMNASVSQKFYDDLRIIYALFRVYMIFILMWLPLTSLILLGGSVSPHHGWYIAALIIAHGNSSVNCLVYAATIEHFRQGYRKILHFGRNGKEHSARGGVKKRSLLRVKTAPVSGECARLVRYAKKGNRQSESDGPAPVSEATVLSSACDTKL